MLRIINDILTYPLFKLGQSTFFLSSIANLFFLLLLVWLITRFIKIICKRWLLPKLGFDLGNQEAITILISYFTGTLGTLLVIQTIGLDFSSFAFVAGGLGIGVGFGLQSITRDFISGLILLLRRSIKVNDFLEFGGRQEFNYLQGTVKNIALLSTLIQTKDGATLILPNSYLVIFPILNWSYGSHKNRLKIPIYTRQDSDLVLFTETVLHTALKESSVFADPLPKLVFKKLRENYLEFELQVWINSIFQEDKVKTDLNYAIEYNLRQQKIPVSFPTYELSFNHRESSIFGQAINDNSTEIASDLISQSTNLLTKTLSIRDLLQKVKYFENFTELELRQLIEIGHRQRLEKSRVLFNEGELGDTFYIILSGSVEIFVAKINKHLANLKAGDFFGELALLLGIPRTASVRALEPTILFVINRQGFEKLLREPSELAEVIIQELGKHQEELAQRQKQLREMGLIDAEEDDAHLIAWVRKRLNRLFSLKG